MKFVDCAEEWLLPRTRLVNWETQLFEKGFRMCQIRTTRFNFFVKVSGNNLLECFRDKNPIILSSSKSTILQDLFVFSFFAPLCVCQKGIDRLNH